MSGLSNHNTKPDDLHTPKHLTLAAAVDWCKRLQGENKTLVMTNGCFDLLHTGHLFFLNKAATLGDALIVALNGDASVRALKGPTRPVQNEHERAYLLGSLACVDAVITFATPRLTREIEAINPDIYVKAGDYTRESLDAEERAALEVAGADIQFLPFLPGYSTTALIRKITFAAKTF